MKLGDWRYQFWTDETTPMQFVRGIAIAIATAIVTSRVGLWVGSGMALVKR